MVSSGSRGSARGATGGGGQGRGQTGLNGQQNTNGNRRSASRGLSRGFGLLLSCGRGQSSIAGSSSRGQSSGEGQSSKDVGAVSHSHKSDTNSKKESRQPNVSVDKDQQARQPKANQKPFERKGPVFGFKRLFGLTSETPDAVILSIEKDIEAWSQLLDSPSELNDELLALVLAILGEKICSDSVTLLISQQFGILQKSNSPNFISKVNEKCQQLLFGASSTSTGPTEIPDSPRAILSNLCKYAGFMVRKMPETALDFLQTPLTTAIATVVTLSIGDTTLTPLAQKFQEIRLEMQTLVKKDEEKKPQKVLKGYRGQRLEFSETQVEYMHSQEAPDDFRNLAIVPTAQELLSKDDVYLRPIRISGAYNNSDHYLDVQFRLLREDFVQPLKKGIQDFMKHSFDYLNGKKRLPMGTIRLYPKVEIKEVELVRELFVYKIQLRPETYKKIKWERSKRLLPGNLLVFTSDFFENAYFAKVANRNVKELAKGIVSVVWEGNRPVLDGDELDEEFLMVECEVFFEAFRHNLEILTKLKLDEFPMAKFIVYSQCEVNPPKFLEDAEQLFRITLNEKKINKETLDFSPLVESSWPSNESLGLDENQYAAFKAALTKEFVIIQGPPGTGKTYLGLRIAEVYLKNLGVWREKKKVNIIPSGRTVLERLSILGRLLERKTTLSGPIVCVCYTNHALDQFLEGILDILEKMENTDKSRYPILRVGGRCSSERLEPFVLQNVCQVIRKEARCQMPEFYYQNRTILTESIDNCRYQRATLMNAVREFRNVQGVVNFPLLTVWDELEMKYPASLWDCFQSSEWFGIKSNWFSMDDFNPDPILRKWFRMRTDAPEVTRRPKPKNINQNQEEQENAVQDGNDGVEEDYDINELMEHRAQDDIYNNDWTRSLNQSGKSLDYIRYLSISRCEHIISSSRKEIFKLEEDGMKPGADHDFIRSEIARKRHAIKRAENEGRFLSRLFQLHKDNILLLPNVKGLAEHLYAEEFEANEVTGIRYKWTIAQRWAIYFEVVDRARVISAKKAQELEQKLVDEHKKLNDLKKHGDSHLLKNSLVVGMTTTGAAKYNDLLQSIKSKIVIVEEAAEVLESHIVTCITKHCEQLILIGDHRQLRPSTTVYDLAKKFHLDLSLFERMINNNLSCYPLKVQHRMRPEISNLVRDSIYKELIDDADVMKYPPVKGMTKNLFFFSHSELEKSESDSLSKSNEFEAKFLAGLCRYLVLQGYEASEITVLSTYTGQMFLLKRYIREMSSCKDVRVTCVDNYQGEENNIILLSLVRSNSESKVGFLAVENRVCVALSRAKMGLYIIGNMSMLKANSDIWSKMEEKLNVGGHCGSVLKLECQVHGTISCITKDSDFREKVTEGGCSIPCEAELKCTHKCVKVCHTRDQSHEEYNCKLPCLKSCENSHPCKDFCYRECSPCDERIEKTLPCGHTKMMACHKSPNEVVCKVPVMKDLECGHGPVELPCYVDPTGYKKCGVRLTKELPCGHEKEMQCHQDSAEILCKELVPKALPCGHEQIAECKILPEMVGCEHLVFVTIEACGHANEMTCKNARNPQKAQKSCKTRCTTRLECGHACTKFCHLTEDPDHEYYVCIQSCFKKCLEGHRCPGKHPCNDPCKPCATPMKRKLKCGHEVTLKCHLDPDEAQCLESCQKIIQCGHHCDNLCGWPCGPCDVKVNKKIDECGHVINIACGTVPTRDMCESLLLPSKHSLCLHRPLVPCKISQTASAEEIMSYCKNPCGQRFNESEGGCGHICSGTCSSCKGGQFHLKCKNECGKTLVCGHVCKFPCSQVCPPCNNDCLMKCEHSVCKTKCGTPCQDCAEKCPWQCEHKSCSKRCGELCDREPCDLPCPKTLQKCGHPCVGFCGEPCPPLCRICDFDELTEWQLLYNEDEEDARFVPLPDCNHSIEVEGLTGHMNTQIVEGQIGVKRCPRCKTIIQNCRRFGNIIKSHLVDVAEVKRKVFGDAKTVLKEQGKLIEKLQKEKGTWDIVLPAIHKFLVHHLVIPVKVPIKRGNRIFHFQEKKVDHSTLECLKQIAHYGGTAVGILMKAKSSLKETLPLYAELFKRYREFFLEITKRQLPLSAFELRDIDRESERLFDLNQVFIRRSSPKFTDGNTRALPIYERLKAFVLSHGPYDPSKRTTLHQLYKELEDVLRTGLGISDMERRQIITAIGLSQGHWYKCPNGHIYAIADCGGPNQGGQCNECGAAIGGQNHRLAEGNTVGREMDGATAPAWPTALMR